MTAVNTPAQRLLDKHYGAADRAAIVPVLRQFAEPLPALDAVAFGELFDRYGEARLVLIGEASHGTSDFYRTRAAITQRLIERHGFTIVAVEADWPDAGHVDRYVRGLAPSAWTRHIFSRFPTWMWRNAEVKPLPIGCIATIINAPAKIASNSVAWMCTACATRFMRCCTIWTRLIRHWPWKHDGAMAA